MTGLAGGSLGKTSWTRNLFRRSKPIIKVFIKAWMSYVLVSGIVK